MLFSSLCFDAQIVFSVMKILLLCVLFKEKKRKKKGFFASEFEWFQYETGMLGPGLPNA